MREARLGGQHGIVIRVREADGRRKVSSVEGGRVHKERVLLGLQVVREAHSLIQVAATTAVTLVAEGLTRGGDTGLSRIGTPSLVARIREDDICRAPKFKCSLTGVEARVKTVLSARSS